MDRTVLLALVGVAVLFLVLGGWLEGLRRTFVAKRSASKAAKHGIKSEKDAEKLLKKLGYQVIQRRPPASYWAVVDGEPQAINLAGDWLLEKGGQSFLAEVKTGKAAKLENEATRRQILEYQLAFGVDAILLLDMDAKVMRTIRFPLPKKAGVAVAAKAKKKKAVGLLVAVGALAGLALYLVVRGGKPGASHDDPLSETAHAAEAHEEAAE
ncbi:MAG TPA: hypothetical protein VFX59_28940 [Polyangiales bacterium]|nr:hypothetical protein [Polyangiales bacterium]